MKRLALLVAALAALCAASGVTASVSMAELCVRTDEQNKGSWTNPTCTEKVKGQEANWIKIQQYVQPKAQQGQWCAEVEKGEPGIYKDEFCKNTEGTEKKYIGVYERPDWFVNGTQLKQGTKQIKLQLKGHAILSVATNPVLEIKCGGSISEGSTIEGNGVHQGQGKGRLNFSSCTTSIVGCETTLPTLTTNQVKAYLATAKTQTKMVEVFQPTEGEKFIEFKLKGKCGVIPTEVFNPAKGSVAAEIIPARVEQKELLLNFPSTAITEVDHEGETVRPGLTFAGTASVFSGAYGLMLASGEPFGAFGEN
jgi:hypothetical protein